MVQTGSKSVQSRESSGNFRYPAGAVQLSVRSLATVQSVVKPFVVFIVLDAISSYELCFECSSARWNREEEPHTLVVFILDLELKTCHFPSHFACIWCLVTSSDSFPFVSFDSGLFPYSTYTYIDAKTRETSKILIKTYNSGRTTGKWVRVEIIIKGRNQYRINAKTSI